MPPRPQTQKTFDEKKLTKGELHKLTALRKSLGKEIADKAFAEWFASREAPARQPEDQNAARIVEALTPLVQEKRVRIPRGGYLLRRGRGRVIVEPAGQD